MSEKEVNWNAVNRLQIKNHAMFQTNVIIAKSIDSGKMRLRAVSKKQPGFVTPFYFMTCFF